MQKNAVGKPFLISGEAGAKELTPLKRLALDKTDYLEDLLQEIIDDAPGLLPVSEIDERIQGRLVSLGREVGTPSGPIDILFISEEGYLIVVETKLWRNPEARRKVVAQVLDYATELRSWDYDRLEQEWRKRNQAEDSLFSFVAPEGLDEGQWTDCVNLNLQQGRMTLIIAGDGIRSDAERLGEGIKGHPQFEFRLGLIEMRLYQLPDDRMLVLPTLLAKTTEIGRVVVQIDRSGEVKVSLPSETKKEKGGKPAPLTEDVFFEELAQAEPSGGAYVKVARKLLGLLEGTDFTLEPKPTGFVVKCLDPSGSERSLSLLYVAKWGHLACLFSTLGPQLKRAWDDEDAAQRVLDAHRQKLESFGLTGNIEITTHLDKVSGQEEAIVQWLNDFVALLRQEAEKLPERTD